MKSEERGRAIMVRALIDNLDKQRDDGGLDCRFIGPLALALADAVMKHDLLLVGGNAFQVERAEYASTRTVGVTTSFLVHVVPNPVRLLCIWCSRPYRAGDSGSSHELCADCWENGPAKEDLQ